jgi:predicted nucleic acid-binding protein
MKLFILDTSVAVAWYFKESFSDQAIHWQKKALLKEATFIVPTLHFYEFANVLRKLMLQKKIESYLAEEVWDLHTQFPFKVTDPDYTKSYPTALAYEATPYDGVYINLALELRTPLITADRKTHTWVKKLGKLAISI